MAVVANVSDEPPVQASQLWRWYEGAGERVHSEAHRRLAVVQLVDTLVAAGMTRSAAVPAAAKDQGVGVSTLWSWLGLVDGVALADRLAHLAPRRQGGGVEATVSLDAWQFLISDFMRPEQPTFSACYGRMTRAFQAHLPDRADPAAQVRSRDRPTPGHAEAPRQRSPAPDTSLPRKVRHGAARLGSRQYRRPQVRRFLPLARWPDRSPDDGDDPGHLQP
ncbi:hypothetical protein JT366_07740 [Sphingomonas paucimobilis]|uniref:DNA-binding domain-containing protein n=1 Tax=Sphingomonas paucimobilis TaxID=13689 RepID=UPI001965DC62|nr:DNA-binding domain-containing protein [Sphingomonas paucimobilis]QRY97117.1 hypothetical protein JT366_07740 [Sphingomonas paucimobilis]